MNTLKLTGERNGHLALEQRRAAALRDTKGDRDARFATSRLELLEVVRGCWSGRRRGMVEADEAFSGVFHKDRSVLQ